MARIGEIIVNGDMPDWKAIADMLPFFRYRLLSNVGLLAARSLYSDKLSSILRPAGTSSSGAPLSRSGRRMVSYSVNKARDAVVIRSYPMNVYRTKGPIQAKRTEGGKILRSFKGSFDANAAALAVLDRLLNGEGGLLVQGISAEWETLLRRSRSSRSGSV